MIKDVLLAVIALPRRLLIQPALHLRGLSYQLSRNISKAVPNTISRSRGCMLRLQQRVSGSVPDPVDRAAWQRWGQSRGCLRQACGNCPSQRAARRQACWHGAARECPRGWHEPRGLWLKHSRASQSRRALLGSERGGGKGECWGLSLR